MSDPLEAVLEPTSPAVGLPRPPVRQAAPRPAKVREFEVTVAEVIQETPDTVTLAFSAPRDRPDYQAGQFLTIRPHQFQEINGFIKYLEDLKGKREPARAYSMCSAPHEPLVAVTVKEEPYISGVTKYPPLLSPLLTYGIAPGTRMVVVGFGGPYVLGPDVESRTDHIVHICAGSGIVPNMSIIKHCLAAGVKLRHTLIYGNKTWHDIIFRDQLAELAAAHPDKLAVVHAISRDPEATRFGANVRCGRVCEELIRELIPDPSAVEVYSCGPAITKFERQAAKEKGEEPKPRFVETVLAALKAIDMPKDRTHYESYG